MNKFKTYFLMAAGIAILAGTMAFIVSTTGYSQFSTSDAKVLNATSVSPDLPAITLQAPPPVPWTAVASTGAVDESSSARYAFDGACVGYRFGSSSVDPITVRYNVVNAFDNRSPSVIPGWTNMELGFTAPNIPDPAPPTIESEVVAILYKVDRCTGQREVICRVTGRDVQPPPPLPCRTCDNGPFPATAIDFTSHLYYVELTVDRTTADERVRPRACTLRIF